MSRFEDRTYENIKSEMMEDVQTDFDVATNEGSLIDLATSLFATRLEEAYNELDQLDQNLLVDTMDREHLIESGAEVGLTIDEGDYAILTGYTNAEFDIGDEFSASDYDYNFVIIESLGTMTQDNKTYYKYNFQCQDLGTEASTFTGDIEPLDAKDGFETGVITGCIFKGADEEDTEEYRARRMDAFFDRASSGNRAYFKKIVDEYNGIASCKIKRREKGDEYINIYVLADGYAVPDDELISGLQEYIDPSDPTGGGYGEAPIGQQVKILKPETVEISVTASIEYKDGYDYNTLKNTIDTAIETYFTSLRKEWADSDRTVVRISGIESAMIAIDGIIDATNIRINDDGANLKLEEFEVPIFKDFKGV